MARTFVFERALDAKILWDSENPDIGFGLLEIKQEPEDAGVENDETEMVDEGLCVSSVQKNKTIKFQFKGGSTDVPGTSQTKSSPKPILKIHDSSSKTNDNCNTVGRKRRQVSRKESGIHGALKKKFKPDESKHLENSPSSTKFKKVRKSVKFRLISTKKNLKTRVKTDIKNKTATSLQKGVDKSGNEFIHKCEDCGSCFQNSAILQKHMRYFSAAVSFKCDLCNASFSKAHWLLKHVKSVHSVTPNENSYKEKCKFCTACFSKKSSLINHLLHSHKKPIVNSDDSITKGVKNNLLSEKSEIQNNNRNNDSKNNDNVATTLNNISQLGADDAKYKTLTVKQDKKNFQSELGSHHFDGSARKSKHSSPVTLVDTGKKESLADSPNMKPSALKKSRKTRIVKQNTKKEDLAGKYKKDETKSPKMRSMPLRRTRSTSLNTHASGSPEVAANITKDAQEASQSSSKNINFEQSGYRTKRSKRSVKDEQLESTSMNKENIENSTSEIGIDDAMPVIGRKGTSSNRSESTFFRRVNKASASNPREGSSRLVSLETPSYKPDDDRNDSNTLMLPSKKGTARGIRCPEENSGKGKFQYVCGYCPRSFNAHSSLVAHRQRKHVKAKTIKCILCPRAFSVELELIEHYISVHLKSVSGIIECCLCLNPVYGLTTMKKHLLCHHQRLNERHIEKFCRECHRRLDILWLRKYCSECKPVHRRKKSKTAVSPNTSTRTSLRFSENLKCTDCECVFQNDDQLKNHQRIQHGTLEYTEQNKTVDTSKVTDVRTARRIKPIQKLPCKKNVRLKSSVRNKKVVKSEKHWKHDKQCVKRSCIGKRPELYARGTNNLLSKHGRKPRQFYNNKCNVCGLKCCCITSLKLHEKRYSTSGKNTCDICGLGFVSKTMLLTHMKSAHIPKILPFHRLRCEICRQGFYNKKFLRIHLSHFHNIKYHQCRICKLRFGSAKRLDNHMRYYSKTLGPRLSCDTCGETFKCKFMFGYHQIQAHDSKKFKSLKHCCDICNCTFPNESLLRAHIGHFHTAQKIRVDALMTTDQNSSNALSDQIFEVNKSVSKFQDCSDHQDMIKEQEKCENKIIDESTTATTRTYTLAEYKCTTCKMSFDVPYDLLDHEWEFSNEGPQECDICERKFVKNHHLMTHKHKHIRDDDKVTYEHECNICREDFTSLEQLKIHGLHLHGPQFSWEKNSEMITNVSNNPEQINGEGVVLFFRKISLNPKVPVKLSSPRCDYCEQMFNGDVSLGVHMRNHAYRAYYTNSSKYLCLICKHKFRTNDVLRAHVIHDHTFDRKESNSTEPETDCLKNSHNVSTESNNHRDGTSQQVSAFLDLSANQKTNPNPNSQPCQDEQRKKQTIDTDVQSNSLLSSKCEPQHDVCSKPIVYEIRLKKLDTLQSLQNHRKSCKVRDKLKCTMCNAGLLNKNSVLLHERRIHRGESRGKPAQSSGNENSIEETENALVLPTKLSIDQQLLKIGRVRAKPPSDTSPISKYKKKYHRNEGRQRRVKYLKKREGDLLEEFNVSIANNDSIIQGEGNGRPHQILVDKIGTENRFTNNRQNKTTGQQEKTGPSARDLRPGKSIPPIILPNNIPKIRQTEKHLAITSEDSECVQPSSTTTLPKDEESKKSSKEGKANPPQSSVNQSSSQPVLNSADYNHSSRIQNTTFKVVQTSKQILPSSRNLFDENQIQLTSIKPTVGFDSVVSDQQTDHFNLKISNMDDVVIKNTNLATLLPNIDTKSSNANDYSITYSSYRIEVSSDTDKISNSNTLCQSSTVSSSSNNSDQNGEASGKPISWKLVTADSCSYCKIPFFDRIKLLEHMKSHRSENQVLAGGVSLSNENVVFERSEE